MSPYSARRSTASGFEVAVALRAVSLRQCSPSLFIERCSVDVSAGISITREGFPSPVRAHKLTQRLRYSHEIDLSDSTSVLGKDMRYDPSVPFVS